MKTKDSLFLFPFEILEGDRGSFLEGLLVLILLWLFGFLVVWVFHQGKREKGGDVLDPKHLPLSPRKKTTNQKRRKRKTTQILIDWFFLLIENQNQNQNLNTKFDDFFLHRFGLSSRTRCQIKKHTNTSLPLSPLQVQRL